MTKQELLDQIKPGAVITEEMLKAIVDLDKTSVKSVNNKKPDGTGNVFLDLGVSTMTAVYEPTGESFKIIVADKYATGGLGVGRNGELYLFKNCISYNGTLAAKSEANRVQIG